MNLDRINHLHLVGIGGIGLSGLASLMLAMGKKVSGSDLVSSEITDQLIKRGAVINFSHQSEHLLGTTDLLVHSSAVPEDNPELLAGKAQGINTLTYHQFLAELMREKYGIAVAGTNGKSTVTAMIGLLMAKAGLDPTVTVGTKVKEFSGNARLGQSKYLVSEACEYQAHMLLLPAQAIVLTNIEEDHLDYYLDLPDIINHFQQFIDKLPDCGLLVINNDDPNLVQLKKPDCQIITYGFSPSSDLMASELQPKSGQQQFSLTWRGKDLGQFSLKLPCQFNVYNALAAIALGLQLKIKPEIIKLFLADFSGLWRRFELIGEVGGVPIISDYAHLPSSLRQTIAGAREFFPKKRIVTVFQPHQQARTKKLFNQFADSFNRTDLLILVEIYQVAGREEKQYQDVSSKQLAEQISAKEVKVIYAKDLDQTRQLVKDNLEKNDLLLILGAGDIYLVGNQMVKK
ncbi:UDP-N-acetylmuramate--L-alanine ligase [Patescibacteria group bacterium]|nr:UDP-N-acetylmuramate--L-alanine ligase [Patescibacteria group bacterium]